MWAGTGRRGEIDAGGDCGHGGECSFRGMSDEYWFCVKHHTSRVRTSARRIDRLGPYATQEEAARALEKAEERNEEWDNDPNWNDDQLED